MTGDLIDIELRQVRREIRCDHNRVPDADGHFVTRAAVLQYRKQLVEYQFDGERHHKWSDWQDVETVEEE